MESGGGAPARVGRTHVAGRGSASLRRLDHELDELVSSHDPVFEQCREVDAGLVVQSSDLRGPVGLQGFVTAGE
jgi:hypothetical protein